MCTVSFINSQADQFVLLKSCSIAESYFKIISRCPGRQERNKIISKNKSKTKLYVYSSVDDVAVSANINSTSRETKYFA